MNKAEYDSIKREFNYVDTSHCQYKQYNKDKIHSELLKMITILEDYSDEVSISSNEETSNNSVKAFNAIEYFLKENFNYDSSWIMNELLNRNNILKLKYNDETKQFFYNFIEVMKFNGSSKNQSIEILLTILDSTFSPEGLKKAIKSSHTELTSNDSFKYQEKDEHYFMTVLSIVDYIVEYSINTYIYENDVKSFNKAINIYLSIIQEAKDFVEKYSNNSSDYYDYQLYNIVSLDYNNMFQFIDKLKQHKEETTSLLAYCIDDLINKYNNS